MKEKFLFLVMLCVSIVFLATPISVKGKTLRELQAELEKTEQELSENKNQKNLTQSEINSINQNVNAIRTSITSVENEMIELQKEISALNEEIKKMDEEIKEVMNFVQISNGESMYLEYAFGAQSFTDFIYRFAVAEQLADYNSNLIDKYNKMIEENNKKKDELSNKKVALIEKQKQLAVELEKLDRDMIALEDSAVSLEDDIKAQKEVIEMYKQKGCSLDEDIKTCGVKLLPTTTAFYRPLLSGYVTSEFGSRCLWLNGAYNCNGHSGIDMSTSEENAKVYAIGTGLVSTIFYRQTYGGNMVFVQHRLKNGETYTSLYGHLRSVLVSVGDVVTRDTVIGIMGGDPVREWWDKASTGTHLHLTIATGLYQTDYYSWSTFQSRIFNPRVMVNFPTKHYVWFKDRLTEYN